MAAVTELSFLLFVLINNIHAEELIIIREESNNYTFDLPKDSNSCLISRFVGEEKLVLWNTSDLWSQNSTLPEDLKQRLSVDNWENISHYVIDNLTHSDSGPYQEECWTDGIVTHEKNISLIICSTVTSSWIYNARLGATSDLPCDGAADNLDVLWLKSKFRHENEIWTRVFGDSTTSVMDSVSGRYQVMKSTSALLVSNFTITDFGLYTCLKMNQQQCVNSHHVEFYLHTKTTYRSVEETAVFPCTVTNSTDEEPPEWTKLSPPTVLGQENHTVPSVDQNYSLVFSSLTLNHSGWYSCKTSTTSQEYYLVVCPKFGPPAVELFSEGEDVTLTCKDWEKGPGQYWFIKSIQTEGKTFHVRSDQSMLSKVSRYRNGDLVIPNMSLKDTGKYWCAVIDFNDDYSYQCLSTTKILLQYRDPFGVYSTFYKVRCSVLSVVLVMLCVVVVAVNQWARRGEQLSAHTHT